MRIRRKMVPGAGMQIGEIAATAAGHQDLLADAIGAFDHQHAPPARAGGRCTHQAGGTAADDDHVKMLHGLWNWCVSRDRRVSFELGILVIASRIAAKQSSSAPDRAADRSEEHTSELQSLMRISYAVFCLKKKKSTN